MSIGASASAPRLCGLVARNTCSTSKWSPTTEARYASLAALATLLRPAVGTATDSTCHLVLVTVMSATLGLLTYKLAPSVPRVAADQNPWQPVSAAQQAPRSEHADVAFAPDRLAADAHPAGGAEPGKEFGEFAGVFRFAGEAADGVDLTGAATLAFDLLPGEIAAAQLDARGALAKAFEIDIQGAGAIQRAQGAYAVAKPREDDRKLRAFSQAAGTLELGGGLKADGHAVDGGWFRVEAGDDWRGAGFPDRLGDACHVELFRTFQFGAPASGAETFFGQAAERGTEVDQGGLVQVEDMGVEVKAIAGRYREAVQVGHAKDEGARPVRQAAGGGPEGASGLEEARVDVRGDGIAQRSEERRVGEE